MQATQVHKTVSPIRITLFIIAVVSCFYPLFFAYIDKTFEPLILIRELAFTLLRLTGIAFISFGVIQAANRLLKAARFVWLKTGLEIVAILFATYWFLVAFWQIIDRPLTGSGPADPASWVFRRYIGLYMLGTLFIYTFLSALNNYVQAQHRAAQAERLQRELAQVRLQALKSQVNPHFLFNSLSVLSSLVHADAALSEQFILQLSKAYRYILEQKDLELVTLREELHFLEAYFFLLRIRFDKKMHLKNEIAVDTERYQLPPLTLQLLVENVVKHNKMSVAEPLTVRLHTEGESLWVTNNISRRETAEPSTGVGLENIQKRYALLTDKKMRVAQTATEFRVKIPLIKILP